MSAPGLSDLLWEADGTVRSARYGDIYASRTGAWAQAQAVFVQGAGLPARWQGRPDWTVLEAGFGLGTNFLATVAAWRADPHRPRRLHHVAIEAHPVPPHDWQRVVEAAPRGEGPWDRADLQALGRLYEQIADDTAAPPRPEAHTRHFELSLEAGAVRLQMVVGDIRAALRRLALRADTLYLDGFAPERNPDMWQADVMRALGRLSRRGTRVATWCVARGVRDALTQAGFVVHRVDGLPPKRHRLEGEYAPSWQPRSRGSIPNAQSEPGPHAAVVIGAGLAGAATARALAWRGWQVQILDTAAAPGAGASGLPCGLFAPQSARRDNPLTQLTRHGVRAMLAALAAQPRAIAWDDVGVVRVDTREGPDGILLGPPRTGWVRPATCIQAWLDNAAIAFAGDAHVTALEPDADGQWRVRAADGRSWSAPHVIVAAAMGTEPLVGGAGTLALVPVRGQVTWGRHPQAVTSGAGAGTRRTPCVQGDGTVVPAYWSPQGPAWVSGASFDRHDTDRAARPEDRTANLARLQRLAPTLAATLSKGPVPLHDWVGLRASTPDRLPIVGPVDAVTVPGLHVLCGLGSRGLTLAALCGDLLAARLHGDPLPLPLPLVRALDPARLHKFTLGAGSKSS